MSPNGILLRLEIQCVLLELQRNFSRRQKDFLSCSSTKLPSRWIQVSSSQVEGGDVVARLRRANFWVSQSIPAESSLSDP